MASKLHIIHVHNIMYIRIYIHACTYVHTCMYICTYMYVHMYMHALHCNRHWLSWQYLQLYIQLTWAL